MTLIQEAVGSSTATNIAAEPERSLQCSLRLSLFKTVNLTPKMSILRCRSHSAERWSTNRIIPWRSMNAKTESQKQCVPIAVIANNTQCPNSAHTASYSGRPWWGATTVMYSFAQFDYEKGLTVFVKLAELHIVTARKPLIHQNQPVAQYLHKIQPCML